MAGCFGNHPFDRIMEQQLMRHLDEESERNCDNCDGFETSSCCGSKIINSDICSDCGEHCDNACEECEYKQYKNT